jgi:dolichol-phosphate mannosyltransferase
MPMPPFQPSIAVVIPAYRVATLIAGIIARIPPEVSHIIVVDDASPDNLREVLHYITDSRLHVLSHPTNRGVGGAMKTGFAKALELEADIIVKIDGDGQMDPGLIAQFVSPIVTGRADMTKGNRFVHFSFVRRMPRIRRLGNVALSFLTKVASGYWHIFDPCNGYLALHARVVRALEMPRLSDRYFFEISLLCEMYFARAVVEDIPMLPVYGDETSALRPWRMIGDFAPKLIGRMLYRIGMSYFLRDFNVVSLLLVTGAPTFSFGVAWSVYHWVHSAHLQQFASTGTVMIGVLAIVLGFQLLLQALALDVANEPGRTKS